MMTMLVICNKQTVSWVLMYACISFLPNQINMPQHSFIYLVRVQWGVSRYTIINMYIISCPCTSLHVSHILLWLGNYNCWEWLLFKTLILIYGYEHSCITRVQLHTCSLCALLISMQIPRTIKLNYIELDINSTNL